MQYLKFFVILFLCIAPSYAWATSSDALACFEATRKVEAEYDIPPHILSAIALTESGRKNTYNREKIHSPWPWTANIRGKGQFFKTKEQALKKFKALVDNKNYMFDIGCMQINWHYHKKAFLSIEQALIPYENVRYAAEFLTNLYERTGSWTKAVERYHSGTPKHYRRYRKVVASNWNLARNLVSPIDGQLTPMIEHEELKKIQDDTIITHAMLKENPKAIKTISAHDKLKIARIKEIAKLRARIRQYAYQKN